MSGSPEQWMDHLQEALYIVDQELTILHWNNNAADLYACDRSEAIGKNLRTWLWTGQENKLDEILAQLKRSGTWSGKHSHTLSPDRVLTLQSRWTLWGQCNEPSITISTMDISDKTLLESRLLRLESVETIGSLACGIAHDLNNVLAPMSMSVYVLRRRLHEKQDREILEVLDNGVKRGAELVGQILSFIRGIEEERFTFGVEYLVQEVVKMLRESFPRNIHIQSDFARNLWQIHGNLAQLQQVLMNLCLNARNAMPNGGSLFIGVENIVLDNGATGLYVAISVRDTGRGIAPEILPKIFDRFFTTRSAENGNGLGLYIVQSILQSHGGFIRVESTPDIGTAFTVFLPASGGSTRSNLRNELQEDSLAKGHGEKILIVDDVFSSREATRILLQHSGYTVLSASELVALFGLYAKKAAELHAVVLNVSMPSIDLEEIVWALRRIYADTRIIGIMDEAEWDRMKPEDRQAFSEHLLRPINSPCLLEALRNTLDDPGKERDE